MKYAVTFCSMDDQADSGILWHSCILFSKLDDTSKKFEVVTTWSFYGMPATDEPTSYTKWLKGQFSLDVDLKGSHGKWRHEETRYLDRGVGLHGRTFELDQSVFERLQQYLQAKADAEDAAINEAGEFLKVPPKKNPRIHRFEEAHPLIFAVEKQKAKNEGRESRLQPFEINLKPSWGLWPIHVRDSSNCKTNVVKALGTELTEEQIASLTEHGKHPSMPRYSGALEKIFLHSRGPLLEHKRKSGERAFYRDYIGKGGVRVFWSIPPQVGEFLSLDTHAFILAPECCNEVKRLVSTLQRIEWALHHAHVIDAYLNYKEQLIKKVISLYEQFSVFGSTPSHQKSNLAYGFFGSLMRMPGGDAERDLINKIKEIKQFLTSIYQIMTSSEPLELDDVGSVLDSEDSSNGGLSSVEFAFNKQPELIVSLLEEEAKQSICTLLGKGYISPACRYDFDYESIIFDGY